MHKRHWMLKTISGHITWNKKLYDQPLKHSKFSFSPTNTGHVLHLRIFTFQMLEVATIYQVQLEMFVLIGLIPHYSKQIESFLTHLPHLIKQNLRYSTSVKATMDFIDVGLISKCHKLVLRGWISRL